MTKLIARILLALTVCSFAEPALATRFLNYKNPTKLLNTKNPREIDSVFNDDVFISGGTSIKFDSRVNGDLFSASYEMVQTGTITGNFMAVAKSIQTLGPIQGSFRAVAWELSCNSNVDRNMLLLAHDINIGPTCRIGRDADIAAASVVFQGETKGNLNVSARSAMISGKVDGDLEFKGDSLTINPNTVITGDINYHSPVRALIAPGSIITGKINWEKTEIKKKTGKGVLWVLTNWIVSVRGYFVLSTLISLLVIASTFITFPGWLMLISLWLVLAVSGNILLLFSRSKAAATEKTLQSRLFPSMGLGFILFFVTPILAAMLLFTVLAAPLAPVILMLFGAAVFAGGIYASLYIGRTICSIFSPSAPGTPGYLCYTIGMTVILCLSFIPILGYLVILVLLMTGLGGLLQTYRKSRPEPIAADSAV